MKELFFIIFILFSKIAFCQTEYRLFLATITDNSKFPPSLTKTDQIYSMEVVDGNIVFYNEAMKYVLGEKTKVYFDEEYIGEYKTKIINSTTHISVTFEGTTFEYFFFKLYSKDRSY